ncbi:protein YaiI [Burkholderiales bacterium GJ-E10]|nr:protein YaiI [Burkholderiales bacterium GJ-E10]
MTEAAAALSKDDPCIWVDADACPGVLRDVLFRAAERTRTRLTMVANKALRTPPSQFVRAVQVARGFDVADDAIVAALAPDDLVVTNDIPLAAQAIARGARVLDMRGSWVDDNTIGDRLATRDLLAELRDLGQASGGPAPLSQADRQAFANRLDQFLTAARR